MKEAKAGFNKIAADMDNALQKNSVVSKTKVNDMEEASSALVASQSCFHYCTVDYVYLITMLQAKKKHEVLDALLSMVKAYGNFFEEGQKLYQGSKTDTDQVRQNVRELRKKSIELDRMLDKRHVEITKESHENAKMLKQKPQRNSILLSNIEGYLFKRGQGAFKVWKRRWFYLKVLHFLFLNRFM